MMEDRDNQNDVYDEEKEATIASFPVQFSSSENPGITSFAVPATKRIPYHQDPRLCEMTMDEIINGDILPEMDDVEKSSILGGRAEKSTRFFGRSSNPEGNDVTVLAS